jgi:hypothetical protein
MIRNRRERRHKRSNKEAKGLPAGQRLHRPVSLFIHSCPSSSLAVVSARIIVAKARENWLSSHIWTDSSVLVPWKNPGCWLAFVHWMTAPATRSWVSSKPTGSSGARSFRLALFTQFDGADSTKLPSTRTVLNTKLLRSTPLNLTNVSPWTQCVEDIRSITEIHPDQYATRELIAVGSGRLGTAMLNLCCSGL